MLECHMHFVLKRGRTPFSCLTMRDCSKSSRLPTSNDSELSVHAQVLGSLELLGNPTGLLAALSRGIQDLLLLPLEAQSARQVHRMPACASPRHAATGCEASSCLLYAKLALSCSVRSSEPKPVHATAAVSACFYAAACRLNLALGSTVPDRLGIRQHWAAARCGLLGPAQHGRLLSSCCTCPETRLRSSCQVRHHLGTVCSQPLVALCQVMQALIRYKS